MLAVTNYKHVLNLYTGLEQVLLYVGQLLILLFKKIQKKKQGKLLQHLHLLKMTFIVIRNVLIIDSHRR